MVQNRPSVSVEGASPEKLSAFTEARESVLKESRANLKKLGDNVEAQSAVEIESQLSPEALEKLALLESAGISRESLLNDSEWEDLHSVEEEQEKQVFLDKQMTERFQALVAEHSVAESLATLRTEFGEQMDEKASSVLANFEALVSPVTIPDKQEREAVELLVTSKFDGNLTTESFTGVVLSIYEQPDTVISQDTKDAIEKKFRIPREPIRTGEDLMKRVNMKDADGKPLYSSEETALEIRPNVHAYVLPSGEVRIVPRSDLPASEIRMSPLDMRDHQRYVDYSNYSIVTAMVWDELDGLENLFGDDRQSLVHRPSRSTMKKLNQFMESILDRNQPGTILSRQESWKLRAALSALNPKGSKTQGEAKKGLQDLGLLNADNFQWHNINKVGRVLRENNFFQSFEMRKKGLANDKLRLALSSGSGVESEGYEDENSDQFKK